MLNIKNLTIWHDFCCISNWEENAQNSRIFYLSTSPIIYRKMDLGI